MSGEIVGRADEREAIDEFLADVGGSSHALVVTGEAGVGKSTLFHAAVDAATARGYTVLRCVGVEVEAKLSFLALGDLLGAVVEDGCTMLSDVQRGALDHALSRADVGAVGEPDAKAVGLAVRNVLSGLAERAPVLLAIDDASWIDASSAAALALVARRLDEQAVGFLATIRTPAEELDPLALERSLGADRVRRITLGPLGREGVIELVEHRFPFRFAPPELRRIAEASGGNPLFALDIAQSFDHSAQRDPGAPLVVPDNLNALVNGRIDTLSAPAKAALLAAAALVRPMVHLVEQASSESGLTEAEESRLVRVECGRVLFTHPLYAAAAYRGASTARRRATHRRLSELVADAEERARHRALGSTGPDESVANELAAAARRAHARGATDSAAEMMEQAYGLSPDDYLHQRCRRGVEAAEFHAIAGDLRRAREILDAVLPSMPDGETRDGALRLLAELVYNSESGVEAARVLSDVADSTHDRSVEARARLRLALVYNQLGDSGAGREQAARGYALATKCVNSGQSSGVLAEALAVKASDSFIHGEGVDVAVLDQVRALEDPETRSRLNVSPSIMVGSLLMCIGDFAEARRLLAPFAAAEMQGIGDGIDGPRGLAFMAWMEAHSGNLELASAYLVIAERRTSGPGNELNRAHVRMHSALVRGLRGEVDRARRDADEAIMIARRHQFARPIPWVTAARAMLENSLGDAAAAWSAVESCIPAVEESGIRDPVAYNFVPEAVQALVVLGDLGRAERLLTVWDLQATKLDRAWALATGARCRALLAAAQRDWTVADEALAEGYVQLDRVDLPIERGRTLLAEGQIRRRRREKVGARRALESAVDLFARSGAVLWGRRADDELERVGRSRRSNELSATEAQVAALVAEGRTNRQVAAELFISTQTVKANLSRVFRTLNVQNRAELAATWARRTAAHS